MLLTRKSAGATASTSRISRSVVGVLGKTIDRRTFLKRSGLTLGAGAVAAQLPYAMVGKANAEAETAATGDVTVKRTICSHCSVGCAIDAVVQNGVWVRQEPVFDSPINPSTRAR